MRDCYKLLLLTGFLVIQTVALAQQNEPPTGEIEDAQIIIEKDRPLTLPKANRYYQKTQIRPLEGDSVEMEYAVTQPSFELEPYSAEISTRAFEPEELSNRPFQNFVKAGLGNYMSPLIQGFGKIADESRDASLWINHESFGKGPVRGKESAYGLSEMLLTGSLRAERFKWSPEVYLRRESYYLFGYNKEAYDNALPMEGAAMDLNRRVGAHHFSISTPITTVGIDKVKAYLKPSFLFSNMKIKDQTAFNSENKVGLDGGFEIRVNDDFSFGVHSNVSHINYESNFLLLRNVFHADPWISYKNDFFQMKAGVKFFSATDSADSPGRQLLYPDVEAELALTESLKLFAEIGGRLQPLTLYNLQQENRYLEDSLLLLNEDVKLDLRAGVSSNVSDQFLISAYVMYRQTRDKGLFVHSPTDTSRFTVIYDSGNFGTAGLGISGKYFLGTGTSVAGTFSFMNYSTDLVDEAWYLPAVTFKLFATHSITELLKLKMDLIILEGIIAPDPVDQNPVDMDAVLDLGFTAQYDFLPQAAAFLDLQNLISKNYERYLNYPSRGMMVKLGFIYRF